MINFDLVGLTGPISLVVAVAAFRKHGGCQDTSAWIRLLHGLWLSGLRLSEAVVLDWNDGLFVLNTTGKHPVFQIESEGQKSRRSEVVPTTPDFAKWILAETPQNERVGNVFPLFDVVTGKPLMVHTIGSVISAIGRKAGVIVGQTEKMVVEDGKRVKRTAKLFAGAHDFRRAFCTRWARKVMPAVLQRLARHSHISTTMAYYVSLSADEIGSELWANHAATVGNTSGNTPQGLRKEKGLETSPKSLF